MTAASAGARVVAVDISADALKLAAELGATTRINSAGFDGDPVRIGAAVQDATSGRASLSLDAFGSVVTSLSSLHSLRRRGRHVQVGALPPTVSVPMPMHRIMGWGLEIVGSHGMAAHTYREMLTAVTAGSLHPERPVTRRVGLENVCELLPLFSKPGPPRYHRRRDGPRRLAHLLEPKPPRTDNPCGHVTRGGFL